MYTQICVAHVCKFSHTQSTNHKITQCHFVEEIKIQKKKKRNLHLILLLFIIS